MEWEPEMEFQGRQQLANALDLSSRLAQKEQTNQQKQQKQSSLFNALCDQRHENRDDNHEPEEDWKQYPLNIKFIECFCEYFESIELTISYNCMRMNIR